MLGHLKITPSCGRVVISQGHFITLLCLLITSECVFIMHLYYLYMYTFVLFIIQIFKHTTN